MLAHCSSQYNDWIGRRVSQERCVNEKTQLILTAEVHLSLRPLDSELVIIISHLDFSENRFDIVYSLFY